MPQVYAPGAHDPRRSVRRHPYQEGPGLLFLATQNGRPARKTPRPSLNEVRRRMRAVRLAAELGIGAACSELGCSTASVYRWLLAFDNDGIEGLVLASRRPFRMRPSITSCVETGIIAIALHPQWTPNRYRPTLRARRSMRA